jgi:hypothetical protein
MHTMPASCLMRQTRLSAVRLSTQIEVTFMSHEHNPFTGKPFFNELLFFHKPSKVLLTTDFFWAYPSDVPFGTKLWKFGMDKIYRPFYFSLMIKDKRACSGHGRLLCLLAIFFPAVTTHFRVCLCPPHALWLEQYSHNCLTALRLFKCSSNLKAAPSSGGVQSNTRRT